MEDDLDWIRDISLFEINEGVKYVIDCSSEGFDEDLIKSKLIELFGDRGYDAITNEFNWFGNDHICNGSYVYLYLLFEFGMVYGGWDGTYVDISNYIHHNRYMTLSDFLTSVYNG